MLTHFTIKFLSIELHETMARAGTDEVSLTEIVMSRSNQELAEVRHFFIDCKQCSKSKLLELSVHQLPSIIYFAFSTAHSRLWTYSRIRDRRRHGWWISATNHSDGRGTKVTVSNLFK